MRKFLSLLFLFALVLTLSSCATSKTENVQATRNFDFYNGIWASDQYELLGATCINFYEINNESGKSWFWNDSDGGKSYEKAATIILKYTDGELYLINSKGEKTQKFKIIDDKTLAMCAASNNFSLEGSMYLHKIKSTDEYIASIKAVKSSARIKDVERKLQGTWISPDGKMKWTFNDGNLIYEQSGSKGINKGSVSYTIRENKVVFRYPGISFDTDLEFKYENGVLTLPYEYPKNSGGGKSEYIKKP